MKPLRIYIEPKVPEKKEYNAVRLWWGRSIVPEYVNLNTLVRYLLIFSIVFFSQVHEQINVGYKLGYVYQGSSYLEAGLNIYKKMTGPGGTLMGFYDIGVGSDFRLGGSKFICGPKLMYEQHILIFGGRTGITCHTDFKNYSPQFSFEGGLSFGG